MQAMKKYTWTEAALLYVLPLCAAVEFSRDHALSGLVLIAAAFSIIIRSYLSARRETKRKHEKLQVAARNDGNTSPNTLITSATCKGPLLRCQRIFFPGSRLSWRRAIMRNPDSRIRMEDLIRVPARKRLATPQTSSSRRRRFGWTETRIAANR
jgi:hypothetical protein